LTGNIPIIIEWDITLEIVILFKESLSFILNALMSYFKPYRLNAYFLYTGFEYL